jgi:DNA-directed RNA polymerase sigma subunit (sigma70/sigma32)
VPAWNDLMDWELFDPLNEPNIYLITVDELLFDFSNTISNLTAEFNIPYENVKEIHDIHSEMLSLQEHKNKDEVTSTIIDAFLNDIDYDYSDITLSLVDEVWIQYSLRENGHELLCDGLNKFPKTVKELRKKSFQV